MKNKLKYSEKEKGIVLLTCLVFLLVLLVMLRYTITSARVEEQKAGIDLDIVSAREAAQSALDFAEFYINRQGQLFCVQERTRRGEDVTQCPDFAGAYANLLFRRSDNELRSIGLNDPILPNLNTLIGNGIYSGEQLNTLVNRGCIPTWICVNWPAFGNVREAASQQRPNSIGATLNPIQCPQVSLAGGGATNNISACNVNVQTQPNFIIERLNATDLDPGRQNLAAEGSPSSRGIVFRITAVGYGRGINNLTSVMVQGTYVIPNI